MTTCPSCGHRWNNGDQYTLNHGLAGERVLDMTSGLLGMQDEVRTIASINLDASAYRKVTVRGDFTSLPFPNETFETVLFDPPHTIDTRNTLLGTLQPQGGLGPHLAAFKYGCYRNMKQLREQVALGAKEAWRVLIPRGTMIFKWSSSEKPFSWAQDAMLKVARFEPYNIRIGHSRANSQNYTSYHWFRKE